MKITVTAWERLHKRFKRLQEVLEKTKADAAMHLQNFRTTREMNANMSQRLDDHERMRAEFQSDVARLERERDEQFQKAVSLKKECDGLLDDCKAMNGSLRWALTHSFHNNSIADPEPQFDIRYLEANVKSAVDRIFNYEEEQKRLQDLLNGTAIAVGILGQKLSRG